MLCRAKKTSLFVFFLFFRKRKEKHCPIVVENKDIKQMLAEKFGVKEEQVFKGQYSWTVVLEGESEESHEND